jgi:DNA-binding MarR family transcriptional regulator
LVDLHTRATCALERSLQDEHSLGVSEFEVLERLASAEKHCQRMQDLADAVHLSQSALSRAVARLEDAGFVSREICSTDRRGIFALITDAGEAAYNEARPTHRRVLSEVLK